MTFECTLFFFDFFAVSVMHVYSFFFGLLLLAKALWEGRIVTAILAYTRI
jgi:hypothetical protein